MKHKCYAMSAEVRRGLTRMQTLADAQMARQDCEPIMRDYLIAAVAWVEAMIRSGR